MRILVTGGTGLVGRALIPKLTARGDAVVVVSRDAERAARVLPRGVEIAAGDPSEPGPWLEEVRACDAVINLVGENVGEGLWTGRKKQRLRRSRLRPTALIADALRDSGRPAVLLSASAAGYYGDGGERALGEDAEPGCDFLAILCHEWEERARQAETERCRVVNLRFGIILAPHGGALGKLMPLYRRGLGGPLGSGRQYMPWIHLQDVVDAILFALDRPAVRGPVNVTAPHPVRQREFAAALGRALRRPAVLPAPAWGLRLLLGEKARMLLQGQRAVPNQLKTHGFRWRFGDLDGALDDVVLGPSHDRGDLSEQPAGQAQRSD